MEKTGDGLKKALELSDIRITSLSFVYNSKLDLTAASKAVMQAKEESSGENGAQGVSTKKLYDTAKIFIGYIQKGEGRV